MHKLFTTLLVLHCRTMYVAFVAGQPQNIQTQPYFNKIE